MAQIVSLATQQDVSPALIPSHSRKIINPVCLQAAALLTAIPAPAVLSVKPVTAITSFTKASASVLLPTVPIAKMASVFRASTSLN